MKHVHCSIHQFVFGLSFYAQTPPRWQLVKTAKLLQSYRDKLRLPTRIRKEVHNKIDLNGSHLERDDDDDDDDIKENTNGVNHDDQSYSRRRRWFEADCQRNGILDLMVDQAIIYETHPYNPIFQRCITDNHRISYHSKVKRRQSTKFRKIVKEAPRRHTTGNVMTRPRLKLEGMNGIDDDEDLSAIPPGHVTHENVENNGDDDDHEDDDILSPNKGHKHDKAMSIETTLSFVGIFIDGLDLLHKLLSVYHQYTVTMDMYPLDDSTVTVNGIKSKKRGRGRLHVIRHNSVKKEDAMSREQTFAIYQAIQQHIIEILKYWIQHYFTFHFVIPSASSSKSRCDAERYVPTELLIRFHRYLHSSRQSTQSTASRPMRAALHHCSLSAKHRHQLIRCIERKFKELISTKSETEFSVHSLFAIPKHESMDIPATIHHLVHDLDVQHFVLHKTRIDQQHFSRTQFHEWVLWGVALPNFVLNDPLQQRKGARTMSLDDIYRFRGRKCPNIVRLLNDYDSFVRWIQFIIFTAYKRHRDTLEKYRSAADQKRSYFEFASLISVFIGMGIQFDTIYNYHSLSAVYYALNTEPIRSIIDSERPLIMSALCQCRRGSDISGSDDYRTHRADVCRGRNCNDQFEIVRTRWDHTFDPNAMYCNFRDSQQSLWKSRADVFGSRTPGGPDSGDLDVDFNFGLDLEMNQGESQSAPHYVPYFALILANVGEYWAHYLQSQWHHIEQLSTKKYADCPEMKRYLKEMLLNGNHLISANNGRMEAMQLGHFKLTTEQCLRLMTNLHCKVRRLFDRCGKTQRNCDFSAESIRELKSFLRSQFALMAAR